MRTSEIDITPLKRALQRLEEGLAEWSAQSGNTLLRDGVIQRFEFTYELSHRMLRRFLESGAANPEEIGRLSFPDLIRVAGERGLLRSSWNEWKEYRQARTNTSHTYDEAKALSVIEVVPKFAAEAQSLVRNLEAQGAGH